MIYFCVKFQKGSAVWFELSIFLHLSYHGNGRHFYIFFNPQKLPHTTVDIPAKFYEVWWKESQKKFNLHFLFPWQLRKSLSNWFRFFFGLSRSTRCGCCSLQVLSISVRRVTCYDNFCVFQFFSILAVSMATAAILKIPKVVWISTHSA